MKTLSPLILATAGLTLALTVWDRESQAATPPKSGAVEPAPSKADPSKDEAVCTSPREFITALEFIRADENFRLKEPEARELALKIADGCDGAARRFIRVAQLLLVAGTNRRDATEWGLKLANEDDARTAAFISAFKRSYLEEYLDLDLHAALKIASAVSVEFNGNLDRVRGDFEKLVDFCSRSKRGFSLPPVKCADFAASVAKKGEPWEGGISGPFIEVFEFLISDSGPALTSADAFRTANQLIDAGPVAGRNFAQAYRYASSEKGLALGRADAIKFAHTLAYRKKPAAPAPAAEVRTETPLKAPAKDSLPGNQASVRRQ